MLPNIIVNDINTRHEIFHAWREIYSLQREEWETESNACSKQRANRIKFSVFGV